MKLDYYAKKVHWLTPCIWICRPVNWSSCSSEYVLHFKKKKGGGGCINGFKIWLHYTKWHSGQLRLQSQQHVRWTRPLKTRVKISITPQWVKPVKQWIEARQNGNQTLKGRLNGCAGFPTGHGAGQGSMNQSAVDLIQIQILLGKQLENDTEHNVLNILWCSFCSFTLATQLLNT